MLVGHEFADDAVVIQVAPGLALVQTVDFFTPVVDDPYRYGKVAAANSLSDVYAMGGRPVTAMNVVCFPTRTLGSEVLSEILRGGYAKIREAGAILAGGHTVEDAEPKYGLAVTGMVDPERVVTKGGARPGDVLVLTKPLGTGIMATAHKKGDLPQEDLEIALEVMETLNAAASAAMVAEGARGATDVTGYGLLGHALEMCRASGVAMRIRAGAVPLLPSVLDVLARGHYPGGSKANRRFVEGSLTWDPDVPEELLQLLADAQTSGGLLIALPEPAARRLLERVPPLHGAPRLIGEVVAAERPALHVVAR